MQLNNLLKKWEKHKNENLQRNNIFNVCFKFEKDKEAGKLKK